MPLICTTLGSWIKSESVTPVSRFRASVMLLWSSIGNYKYTVSSRDWGGGGGPFSSLKNWNWGTHTLKWYHKLPFGSLSYCTQSRGDWRKDVDTTWVSEVYVSGVENHAEGAVGYSISWWLYSGLHAIESRVSVALILLIVLGELAWAFRTGAKDVYAHVTHEPVLIK
jgi:hypothetical protein